MFKLDGRRGFVYFLPARAGAFEKRFFNLAFGNDAARGKAVEADSCVRSEVEMVGKSGGDKGEELPGREERVKKLES